MIRQTFLLIFVFFSYSYYLLHRCFPFSNSSQQHLSTTDTRGRTVELSPSLYSPTLGPVAVSPLVDLSRACPTASSHIDIDGATEVTVSLVLAPVDVSSPVGYSSSFSSGLPSTDGENGPVNVLEMQILDDVLQRSGNGSFLCFAMFQLITLPIGNQRAIGSPLDQNERIGIAHRVNQKKEVETWFHFGDATHYNSNPHDSIQSIEALDVIPRLESMSQDEGEIIFLCLAKVVEVRYVWQRVETTPPNPLLSTWGDSWHQRGIFFKSIHASESSDRFLVPTAGRYTSSIAAAISSPRDTPNVYSLTGLPTFSPWWLVII